MEAHNLPYCLAGFLCQYHAAERERTRFVWCSEDERKGIIFARLFAAVTEWKTTIDFFAIVAHRSFLARESSLRKRETRHRPSFRSELAKTHTLDLFRSILEERAGSNGNRKRWMTRKLQKRTSFPRAQKTPLLRPMYVQPLQNESTKTRNGTKMFRSLPLQKKRSGKTEQKELISYAYIFPLAKT